MTSMVIYLLEYARTFSTYQVIVQKLDGLLPRLHRDPNRLDEIGLFRVYPHHLPHMSIGGAATAVPPATQVRNSWSRLD